ncbi:hypothetical protein BJX66DRAFT_210126 [Aspergillus keveii]|uniref:Zn(2)-C6 fungal-type domain-containing protein n=1 Tax=Aspergillus keveii TaxID=714993 RepID=A0ABR4GLK5_9EURO
MNLDDEAETLTLRSACSRCHGHKLRCVQVRGAQGCVRCTRAGVKCVARPSKRVRQNQRQGWEHGKKNTRLEHSSSRGASRSGCRCMEQGQSVAASPSVRIAETVEMGQSRLNDLPLTPHTPANDFDVISYWETFESEDQSSSLPTLEEGGNLSGLHLSREDLGFQPAMHVDVDVDMNCAALDPATLSVLLPSPASTDLSQEWNRHPQSTESSTAHENGNDYFSPRETTSATTQKCEEQDRESNTHTASDWVAGVFTLNAKVGEHQRAMRTFIEAYQRGFVEFSINSPAMALGSNPPMELSPNLGACTFLETILHLAMELLAFVSEEIPASLESDLERSDTQSSQASRNTIVAATGHFTKTTTLALEDTANILLMLSCYTRLLGLFSSVFEGFHHTILANPVSSESSCQALDYIHIFLPKMYIGTVSLQKNTRLALRMVLDSVQNMVAELTRGMMRVVQFVDRNDDGSTTSAGTQMPEEEGLVDRSLGQKTQVSDLTGSLSRTGMEIKVRKDCGGDPSSSTTLSEGESGTSSKGVLLNSWQTTIQTVSSTALDTIIKLKDTIV